MTFHRDKYRYELCLHMRSLVDDTVVTLVIVPTTIKSFAIRGTLAMGVALYIVKPPLSISPSRCV